MVFSLQALLRIVWLSGTRTREEIMLLLERIKQADNLKISQEAENKIFEQEATPVRKNEKNPQTKED
ncbi:MAG: hypothetical protein GY801_45335 [bacterium]|nr:hypothetical protein [bacterium]